jgi:predicted tellurium resistance membrane protein TerC
MEQLHTAGFWWALARIVAVGAVLCAESAVVLALVVRGVPPGRRIATALVGGVAALLMRAAACLGAMALWPLPGVPALAGGLMLWFGLRLLVPEHGGREHRAREHGGRARVRPRARRIATAAALAEALTALGHGVAIAAAADGSWLLAAAGVGLAALLLALIGTGAPRLLRRVPGLLALGAALLAWGGAGALAGDPLLRGVLPAGWGGFAPPIGAALVLAAGWILAGRAAPASRAIVDLAPADRQ